MSPLKKVNRVASIIFLNYLIFINYGNIIYCGTPVITTISDGNYALMSKHSKPEAVSGIPTDNFYKNDSIFSFRSEKGYVPSLLHNFSEQATAPFHFSGKEWILTGASAGVTAALMHYDNYIDEWARTKKQQYPWVHKTSPVITQFGGTAGVLAMASFGALSASLNSEKGVQTSLLATQAMITSGVWVRLIKMVTSRERPMASYANGRTEGGYWYGPLAQYDQDQPVRRYNASFDSFPSGHTATAFSIATVFATQYSDIKMVPVISYSLAGMVGVSRLIEHEHWASDVFVGGLLGYVCGRQVVTHFNKLHQAVFPELPVNSPDKPQINFIGHGNQFGLAVKW